MSRQLFYHSKRFIRRLNRYENVAALANIQIKQSETFREYRERLKTIPKDIQTLNNQLKASNAFKLEKRQIYFVSLFEKSEVIFNFFWKTFSQKFTTVFKTVSQYFIDIIIEKERCPLCIILSLRFNFLGRVKQDGI